jgi:L-asparaginase type I
MRPRLCILYTGGTIAMVRDERGDLVPPRVPTDFLSVAPELEDVADIDVAVLMNKDSTNIVPDDWTTMAEAIYERRHDGYAGFIVAHGTDTMHFSASAVSLALGPNLPFPVVFTGAQTIPEVAHGDARVNLLRAARVAVEDIAEVVIAFGENVFRGCRAQKKDERRFDAFEAPAMFPLAYVTEDILVNPLTKRRPVEADVDRIKLQSAFASGVVQVSLIPGLEPAILERVIDDPRCHGLILQSLGAGNVPDVEEYSFEGLIERAREADKPVIVTSQFPASATLDSAYATSRAAIAAGAIPTGNMTASCAVAKFRWVLARVEQELERGASVKRVARVSALMNEIYVGEMDDSSDRREQTHDLRGGPA